MQRLNDVQNRISKEINESLADQIVELLVEVESKGNPEILTGRTRTNKLVHFKNSENLTGKLVQVKITETRTWNLIGELQLKLDNKYV